MIENFFNVILEKMDITKTIVCLSVVTTFCFQAYVLAYVEIPLNNEKIFTHFMGIVDASMGFIVGYYFGTSKSSAKKTELIDKMVDKNNPS